MKCYFCRVSPAKYYGIGASVPQCENCFVKTLDKETLKIREARPMREKLQKIVDNEHLRLECRLFSAQLLLDEKLNEPKKLLALLFNSEAIEDIIEALDIAGLGLKIVEVEEKDA